MQQLPAVDLTSIIETGLQCLNQSASSISSCQLSITSSSPPLPPAYVSYRAATTSSPSRHQLLIQQLPAICLQLPRVASAAQLRQCGHTRLHTMHRSSQVTGSRPTGSHIDTWYCWLTERAFIGLCKDHVTRIVTADDYKVKHGNIGFFT